MLNKKIKKLISQMTLDEKIGQTALRGTSSQHENPLPEDLKKAVREGRIGAFLNIMNTTFIDELQHIAVNDSPNKIPLIFARDVIHGFKTIFPIPLGIAATWDMDIAKMAARISAVEATSIGIRWTFAPMLDIARDSRWGRIAESPGEDPYLASLLAKAYVEGFQGDDLTDPTSMAACAKHFVGYGAAIGGRDYNTVIIHEPLLRNVYLPPFKAAVDAGALTVMAAFNELNGTPVSGNKFLLKDVLRDDLKFDGFVVSDWNSVTEMIPHGFAQNEKQAASLSVNAGLDMEMNSESYENNIKSLIEEGVISIEQLDFLVSNILRVKLKLGLFDSPFRDKDADGNFYSPAHMQTAKEAAIKSMVLLKNKNILPLDPTLKIAIIGPLANAPHEQLGTWIFDGDKKKSITPVMAFNKQKHPFEYSTGLSFSRDSSIQLFEDAIEVAQGSDVILFFGGEESILSGEAHSRADISLPGKQEELLTKLADTGKPVVLVIMAGRPISITKIIDKVDAVLIVWHPGTMGGPALYDVLTGIEEPGGRLPVSWPKSAGQLPLYYNHKNTGRPADSTNFVHMDDIPIGAWQSSLGNTSHYLDAGYLPLFPFGYGLTYTTFSYSKLKLSSNILKMNGSLKIEFTITNNGDRSGTEIVQLYIQDVVGSITRPVKELKGFRAVKLEKGESKIISFRLYSDQLKFVNNTFSEVLEPGKFNLWVGPNSASGINTSFEVIK